jgi:hypothetical protein
MMYCTSRWACTACMCTACEMYLLCSILGCRCHRWHTCAGTGALHPAPTCAPHICYHNCNSRTPAAPTAPALASSAERALISAPYLHLHLHFHLLLPPAPALTFALTFAPYLHVLLTCTCSHIWTPHLHLPCSPLATTAWQTGCGTRSSRLG